jgi:hypothetical protein
VVVGDRFLLIFDLFLYVAGYNPSTAIVGASKAIVGAARGESLNLACRFLRFVSSELIIIPNVHTKSLHQQQPITLHFTVLSGSCIFGSLTYVTPKSLSHTSRRGR